MRIFNTLKTDIEAAKALDDICISDDIEVFETKAWGIIDVIADDFIINGHDLYNLEYARREDLPIWWNAINVAEDRTELNLSVTIGDTEYSLYSVNKEDLYDVVYFTKHNNTTDETETVECGEMYLTTNMAKFFFAQLVTEYNIPVYTIDDLVAIENGERSYCLWIDGDWQVEEYECE